MVGGAAPDLVGGFGRRGAISHEATRGLHAPSNGCSRVPPKALLPGANLEKEEEEGPFPPNPPAPAGR